MSKRQLGDEKVDGRGAKRPRVVSPFDPIGVWSRGNGEIWPVGSDAWNMWCWLTLSPDQNHHLLCRVAKTKELWLFTYKDKPRSQVISVTSELNYKNQTILTYENSLDNEYKEATLVTMDLPVVHIGETKWMVEQINQFEIFMAPSNRLYSELSFRKTDAFFDVPKLDGLSGVLMIRHEGYSAGNGWITARYEDQDWLAFGVSVSRQEIIDLVDIAIHLQLPLTILAVILDQFCVIPSVALSNALNFEKSQPP